MTALNATRIRRRGEGDLGTDDSPVGAPYLLEFYYPGQPGTRADGWNDWGHGYNSELSAAWDAHAIFGAPRPTS